MKSHPLQGVVIADFTRILAGPLATMVLADLGATVIKIERTDTGDDTRAWGPPFAGEDAAYFLSINRNKKSIALDLNEARDIEIAHEIVARSDVLIENFRTGVMDHFGLGFDGLATRHPRLVYCSIPAFLHHSRREEPGYDLLMQAASGLMSLTGEPGGRPLKTGVALLDVIAGLYAAIGVLSALRKRDLSGKGRLIEVGLFESSLASLINQGANYLVGGEVPSPKGNAHPNIAPYQDFAADDGDFVLAAANNKLFANLCQAIGRDDLGNDLRYSSNAARVVNRRELTAELNGVFSGGSVEHWVSVLGKAGIPVSPVRSLDQVFASPEGRSMVEVVEHTQGDPVALVGSPIRTEGVDPPLEGPPRLDEHRPEILRWIASTPKDHDRRVPG